MKEGGVLSAQVLREYCEMLAAARGSKNSLDI